jgi:cytochrome c oxidase assembly protein subunit 15
MLVTRRHRNLLVVASLLTYLLVTLGGVVCVTDSSRGCPDWPGCYGRLVPPPRLDSILEYTHRLLAGLASLAIIASAIAGWRSRIPRWVRWPPTIAVFFLLAVIVFGAMVVLRGLEPGLAALDLGSALIVLGLVLTSTVVAIYQHRNPSLPNQLSFDSTFAKLALRTLVSVFVVLVSGVLVAESGSVVRCLGWPLYGGPLNLGSVRGWFQAARCLAGGLTGLLVIAVVVQAWRAQEQQRARRAIATAGCMAFAIEIAVGALILWRGFSVWLHVIYAATAVALWALLVVLVVWAGLLSSSPTDDNEIV